MTEAMVMSLTSMLSTAIILAFWEPPPGNKYAFFLTLLLQEPACGRQGMRMTGNETFPFSLN